MKREKQKVNIIHLSKTEPGIPRQRMPRKIFKNATYLVFKSNETRPCFANETMRIMAKSEKKCLKKTGTQTSRFSSTSYQIGFQIDVNPHVI